jgi:hypothetical protein
LDEIAPRRAKRQKMEFSKKLFIGIAFFVIIINGFAMYMIWITQDLFPLPYLLTGSAGLLATAVGFYYRKAQAENEIKIGRRWTNENPYSSSYSEFGQPHY